MAMAMADELVARKIVSSGVEFSSLPNSYVRPESDRPNLSEVCECEDLPLIDLATGDWSLIVSQIREACRHYGFFQVINHGVPHELMDGMLEVSKEFFNLPVEEKVKLYSEDPSKTTRFATSFNYAKESVHLWRDFLRLHCYPLEENVSHWPSLPPSFKDIASNYSKEVRRLNFKLLEAISESLDLDKDFINTTLGEQGQHMTINYYPPCPQPELTYGLPIHTDPNSLTVLLPDSDVPGLQVLKDDKWISVKPHPHAFVINIADQLQALSNDKYTSVCHRAVVNYKARISVVTFLCPSFDAGVIIRAPKGVIEEGCESIYRDFTYGEYFKTFWNRSLDDGPCLHLFRN